MSWHNATVTELVKESPDSVSITLEPDAHLQWVPGQHVQVKVQIDGREYKRVFSISSEIDQALRLTVKQSPKGVVSKYFNKKLALGEHIQISTPAGRFCHIVASTHRKSYYFFAAGSGITPIYAMMTHILAHEPQSFVYLLYGNKNAKQTIFKQQLEALEQTYNNTLVIRHCHSSPGWLDYSPWHSGRVDATSIAKFIQENPPYAQDCQYYICGPDQFIPNVKQALNDIDVPDSCIHKESFGGAKSSTTDSSGISADMKVNAYGEEYKIEVTEKQSLLRAMLQQQLDVPYSCEAGVCGTCQCRIVKGEVSMLNNSVLNSKELKQGKILACQAYPKTDQIEIQYD